MILTLGLATAARADDTVICKDGTTSMAGRGACSGHGGVDKKATKAKAAKEGQEASTQAKETDTSKVTASGADVVCKDGTTSKGGKGACSGHGGIDKKAKKEKPGKEPNEQKVAAPEPTPATPASPKAAPVAVQKAPEASKSASEGKPANTDPTGAIARCKDGTYSHAKNHEGACSRHGGVADWLDKK
jgi:hypothetical protein